MAHKVCIPHTARLGLWSVHRSRRSSQDRPGTPPSSIQQSAADSESAQWMRREAGRFSHLHLSLRIDHTANRIQSVWSKQEAAPPHDTGNIFERESVLICDYFVSRQLFHHEILPKINILLQ
jgi:hypothetical protein